MEALFYSQSSVTKFLNICSSICTWLWYFSTIFSQVLHLVLNLRIFCNLLCVWGWFNGSENPRDFQIEIHREIGRAGTTQTSFWLARARHRSGTLLFTLQRFLFSTEIYIFYIIIQYYFHFFILFLTPL